MDIADMVNVATDVKRAKGKVKIKLTKAPFAVFGPMFVQDVDSGNLYLGADRNSVNLLVPFSDISEMEVLVKP